MGGHVAREIMTEEGSFGGWQLRQWLPDGEFLNLRV